MLNGFFFLYVFPSLPDDWQSCIIILWVILPTKCLSGKDLLIKLSLTHKCWQKACIPFFEETSVCKLPLLAWWEEKELCILDCVCPLFISIRLVSKIGDLNSFIYEESIYYYPKLILQWYFGQLNWKMPFWLWERGRTSIGQFL